MPIYVYGCNACGAVEEHIQRFSDPPLTECSSCGGRLEKQVTTAAFQLKGGGWYKDLYASAKPDKGGGSDSGGSSGGSDSGGSKGSDSGGSKGSDSSGSSGSKGSDASGSSSSKGSGGSGDSGGSKGSSGGKAAAAE